MRKYYISLFAYLVMNGCAVASNSTSNDKYILSFVGINKIYEPQMPIEFSIQSHSDKDIYYYCSVEKKIDSKWREIIPSINATKVKKSVRLTNLKANSLYKLKWDYNKQHFYIKNSPGTYRFKLNIFKKPGTTSDKTYFSSEFEIKNKIQDSHPL